MTTRARASARRTAQPIDADERVEIATDALIYAYPLVLMEMTRRAMTNVECANTVGQAPINQFSHMAAFPDPTSTAVVRPNADTLYSALWYDVAREPLVISVADGGDRYYLLECLDLWTDVFESIGSRTTGERAVRFALLAPGWEGTLPSGTLAVRSPTSVGFVIGRTQTNGTQDYGAVHEFQRGIVATPLSQFASPPASPEPARVNPAWQTHLAPVDQVEHMAAEAFLSTFAHAARGNPPHANDYPILHRMCRIGLEPGKLFSFSEISGELRESIDEAWPVARDRIKYAAQTGGTLVNGWRIRLGGIGTYGADYLQRAAVAYFGLGANTPDDAIYPSAFTDADGAALSCDQRYQLHFDADALPPVRAFWSLTLYDERQLFAANPIGRYALGDRDPLRFNEDGSLDLYIQRQSPGQDRHSNWLPAPEQGTFSMNLRLYWPTSAVRDGRWAPPPVRRVSS